MPAAPAPPYLMLFPRPNFRGLNDKYLEAGSRYGITPVTQLKEALSGRGLYDVLGGAVSQNYRDLSTERISRYEYNWRFYNGQHWQNPWEDGEQKTVYNLCKLVVDKGVSFFIADGWKVKCPEGNEQIAIRLNEIWEENNRDELTGKILQFGGITGDCFVYVSIETSDVAGNLLDQKDWRIRLSVLDPKYCYPFFSRIDPTKLEAILIQYPITSPDSPDANILYTLFLTSEEMVVWHNEVEVERMPNPFGFVPVVHYKNAEIANSNYGAADIDPIIPLNEEYNIVANSIRRTIKYQGEPTTLVFGARVSDLERGAKKVWSNLPEKAKVENLKLEGELQHTIEHLKNLEDRVFKIGGIPKIALESSDTFHVSNTSGVAIQMLFQPLIEKTKQRRVGFSRMVKGINELILIGLGVIGESLEDKADKIDAIFESRVEYTSPLPRDRGAEIDQAVKLREEGVWSRAEMIRRVSDVEDLERLVAELVADKAGELFQDYEAQRAVNGQRPSALAAFLGSPTLSEDLQALADAISKIKGKSVAEPPPVKAPKSSPAKKPKTRVRTAA